MKHEIENLKNKWQQLKWWLKWHEGEILFAVITAASVAIGYSISHLGG